MKNSHATAMYTHHLAIAFLLALIAHSSAATFNWTGTAVLGPQWSRAGNWSGNNVPPSNGTADLVFTGNDRTDNEADTNWSIRSITFAATNFQISGSTLTIGSGGVTNDDDSAQEISNAILLSAAQTWRTNTGAQLSIDGSVNNAGHLLTLDTVSGPIVLEGGLSGTGGLTKNGIGIAAIRGAGANTFSGTTTVTSGTLLLAKSAGVNAIAGALVIGNGSGTGRDRVQLGARPIRLRTRVMSPSRAAARSSPARAGRPSMKPSTH